MFNKNIILSALVFLFFSMSLSAQGTPVGIWETIDDETDEAKSHVEVFEKDGKFHGKIVKLLQKPADTLCDKCVGDKKDKPLMGMKILWNLEPHKDYWSYGKIMDPNNGKTYKCSIWLDGESKLQVRGYIGISALGRNQTWHRVE